MDKITFYLDEHIPKAVAKGLRQRGIPVVTCSEIDTLGYKDIEHLSLAFEKSWVIVTRDNDFLILHAEEVHHAGIVFASQPLIGQYLSGLILIYEVLDMDDMSNHVEFI